MQDQILNFDAAIKELRTLRDMLRFAVTQFYAAELYFGHGTDNPWDEAIFLALHTLQLPSDFNKDILDARLLESERHAFARLIAKRIKERKPAAYLTQKAYFAGLSFYVDERVIIPRSPIAELIEKTFEPWVEPHEVHQILDLCTGSGCIAIACAYAFPDAQIDAADISKDALAVADINVKKHGVENQVKLIQTDLFNNLPQKSYDLIVSNPPYVDAHDMACLAREYQHEPKLALEAGEKGLEMVKRILQEARRYLSAHGVLIVEVGNSASALEAEYPHVPFLWLEFERGGYGVFLLTADQLKEI